MAHEWTDEELTKFYEGVNSALKKLLRKINSKVSTADLESQLVQLSSNATLEISDSGLETTVSDLEGRMSTIEQTASSIELRVIGAETELGTAQSAITQLADSITLSVEEGTEKVSISLNVNGETQTASIDMSGLVTFTDLSTQGKTTIHGGNIDTESLFSQDIQTTGLTLVRSSAGFPAITLEGGSSGFSISPSSNTMANPYTIVNSDNEIVIQSGEAIVLLPGSGVGASGESGVYIEGSITGGTWEGEVIGIAHGGTGATTAAQARENLGIGSDSGAESGSWTPSVSGGSGYSRRQGWYIKVGSVVTIGWDVYCSGTSSGRDLCISGVPYSPGVRGWGGGACSGYDGSDVVFSGWELSTDGSIYGQGQSLSTSGTKYEETLSCSGGAMYAGGTITFTL